ncbi:MAG: CTP synthase (glutamine hydrolyzing) [Planctomycetia bacterium]|nr:CTP synthase (glutamine hydrolyzing) [Planctomycetia bacterium]
MANTSDETEFYTPVPRGYEMGKTKYVAVFGTVMSGLGKGIFASSLAKLLQDKGFKVAPIKLEGYLNIDSGTLNPYRHGEVFVLDDGMECDMDLGNYERMLDQNLTRDNFTTSGQIFTRVLEKERRGGYLGRDVQMIPHVTGEVKLKLRELATKTGADIIFVEIGGTAGDFENSYYIEAMRQLAYEEGPRNVCFVALTLILEPKILGEQKSKAAQLGIKRLMGMGIQPQIIACRAASPVTQKVREKISIHSSVPMSRVFSMHDLQSTYLMPDRMKQEKLDEEVLRLLDLQGRTDEKLEKRRSAAWQQFCNAIINPRHQVTIGVTGKYTAVRDSYASLIRAVEDAGTGLATKATIEWIDTTKVTDENVEEFLGEVDGIIVPGGFGTRGTEGKIACIRYARETRLPYLGICFGFQMAVIEFARNVCGISDAHSSELKPGCANAVIDILPEQKKIEGLGGNMRLGGHDVLIKPDTLAYKMFKGAKTVRLRFRHRYEVDPRYIDALEDGGMVFSGKAPDQPIMQILELPGHPYFVGTQAHPEFSSRPLSPSPFYLGLVAASLGRHAVLAEP